MVWNKSIKGLILLPLTMLLISVGMIRSHDGTNYVFKVITLDRCKAIVYGNNIYIISDNLEQIKMCNEDFMSYLSDFVDYSVYQSHVDTTIRIKEYKLYLLLSNILETDYEEVDLLIVDSSNTIIGFCQLAEYHMHLYNEGIYSYLTIDSVKGNELYYTVYEGIGLKLTLFNTKIRDIKNYIDSVLNVVYIQNNGIFTDLKYTNEKVNGIREICLERRYHSKVNIVLCGSTGICSKEIGYSEYILTDCY